MIDSLKGCQNPMVSKHILIGGVKAVSAIYLPGQMAW